jgi:pyruvate/2-oxoglutarate/acetoin dehydrogenase E1 component
MGGSVSNGAISGAKTSVLAALNEGLHAAFAADESVVLLGEDLLDPYGGAFKVPRGLSTAYPERVWASPVSESGLAGIATGMALRGLRPVVEIMFGDFISLTFDQLLNSATKYAWMFGGDMAIPVVVRTPMGGRRGYGPTHSQTIEKHFLGIAGLNVVAPCAFGNPGALLKQTILEGQQPTLFVENKLLYLERVNDPHWAVDFERHDSGGSMPTYTFTLKEAPAAQLTITAYGYMAGLALEAAQQLAYEYEVFVEVVIPTLISFPTEGLDETLSASLKKSRHLLAVEEGSYTLGWGAEVLARAAELNLVKGSARVAAANQPIPASMPMEEKTLPSAADILESALRVVKAG